VRDECPNTRQTLSIEDARRRIEAWREEYETTAPRPFAGATADDVTANLDV